MHDDRLVESWTWYAVAALILVLRYASRVIRLRGWTVWEVEDYVMLLTFAVYTNFIVFVNVQQKHPFTNILPPTGTKGMSDAELKDRVYGAKVTFTLEESMVMIQFLCKISMCFLYLKLTDGLKRQFWVKLLIGYIVVGWATTEIFFFGIWCRPVGNYFRVFDGNSGGCTTAQNHLKMSFAFNISADVLMLAVPLPLLLQSQLPWRSKMIVSGIFSLGIFVVVSAALSRYYVFAHPESILWIFWYVREASTAIIVANLPHLYALLRHVFRVEFFDSIVKRSTRRTGYTQYQLDSVQPSAKRSATRSGTGFTRSESTENIAPKQDQPLQIWQHKAFEVNATEVNEDQWDVADGNVTVNGRSMTRAVIVTDQQQPPRASD